MNLSCFVVAVNAVWDFLGTPTTEKRLSLIIPRQRRLSRRDFGQATTTRCLQTLTEILCRVPRNPRPSTTVPPGKATGAVTEYTNRSRLRLKLVTDGMKITSTKDVTHLHRSASFIVRRPAASYDKKLSYRRERARQLRIHAQLTRCFSAVAV